MGKGQSKETGEQDTHEAVTTYCDEVSAVNLSFEARSTEFYTLLLALKALAENRRELRGLQAPLVSQTLARFLLRVSVSLHTSKKLLLNRPRWLRYSSASVWCYQFNVDHEAQKLKVAFVRKNDTDDLELEGDLSGNGGGKISLSDCHWMGGTKNYSKRVSTPFPSPSSVLEGIFNPMPWLVSGRACLLWPTSVSVSMRSLLKRVPRKCMCPPWSDLPECVRRLVRVGFVVVLAKERGIGSQIQIPIGGPAAARNGGGGEENAVLRPGVVTWVCALIFSEQKLMQTPREGEKGGSESVKDADREKDSSDRKKNEERGEEDEGPKNTGEKEKKNKADPPRLHLHGAVTLGGLGSERRGEVNPPVFPGPFPEFNPDPLLGSDSSPTFWGLGSRDQLGPEDFRVYVVQHLTGGQTSHFSVADPEGLISLPEAPGPDAGPECLAPECTVRAVSQSKSESRSQIGSQTADRDSLCSHGT
uniref:Uncharacterized protein n=1 Tax=Chromera velia CCMP2878 TaxID=1169474 RepID=A0A0G4HTZ0_9ALVE|eukprot:Cvel_8510.t1-p1 / transcript=Cvel_8510.t1 / gene=Cvel_8510 / organism=Chromera_velia_CCMP2878 / gene_product=hypothetical protein / transcript_product=hypothetical protein / location=Cvel_scaffold471:27891-29309(+) / protein_length=473 / sequence_SO=supercontig / SO=protein_coding / is_pseudo=false